MFVKQISLTDPPDKVLGDDFRVRRADRLLLHPVLMVPILDGL